MYGPRLNLENAINLFAYLSWLRNANNSANKQSVFLSPDVNEGNNRSAIEFWKHHVGDISSPILRMTPWTRPEAVPFPSIWRTFQGRKVWNGHKRNYWIQDITEEYMDQVIHYMCTIFLRDEPMCMFSGATEEIESVEEFRRMWKELLALKAGLVCLTKDENGEIKVAGINCTCPSVKDEKDDIELKAQLARKLYGTCDYMSKKVDPFKKFGLTAYLSAMGLVVPPEFRGEGIGLELLKAREPLCRALGLKATLTVFTSYISQGLAEKAGFKDLYRVSYADLGKDTGKFIYPGIEKHTKDIKFMYLLYE